MPLLCWPRATSRSTKVPSVGTPTQAGLPAVVMPSQGSLLSFGASLIGEPNTSDVVGARKTSDTVPRSSRSWIGRYSSANLKLLVLPKVLYFE